MSTSSALQLTATPVISITPTPIAGLPAWIDATAAGDFDGDGYPDLAVASSRYPWITWAKNTSSTSTTTPRTPSFVLEDAGKVTPASTGCSGTTPCQSILAYDTSTPTDGSTVNPTKLAVGDFDGNGCPDILIVRTTYTGTNEIAVLLDGKSSGGTCDASFTLNASPLSNKDLTTLGSQAYANGHAIAVFHDASTGLDDAIVGNAAGQVIRLTSSVNGSGAFSGFSASVLLTQAQTGYAAYSTSPSGYVSYDGCGTKGPSYGVTAVEAFDFGGTGAVNLLISDVAYPTVELFLNNGSGGFNESTTSFPDGDVANLIAGDFNADGKMDVAVAVDHGPYLGGSGCPAADMGGDAFVYYNTGSSPWFSSTPSLQLTRSGTTYGGSAAVIGYDNGAAMDYDENGTTDLYLEDGDDNAVQYMMINRTGSVFSYPASGTATSTTVDPTAASNGNIAIVSACLTPSATLAAGTSITYQLSSDGGAHFVNAVQAGGTGPYCATFNVLGNDLVWRATLSSNSTDSATPTLSGVSISYTYENAAEHVLSGTTVQNKVKYFGTDRFPGDQGHLFAYQVQDNTAFWAHDAGYCLDNPSACGAAITRTVYTAIPASAGAVYDTSLQPFDDANDANLQTLLGAPDLATAQAIIDWTLSARFGLDASFHVLGGIAHSTAAVLSAPGYPYWYTLSTTPAGEKSALTAFVSANATRPQLVFVGAKDGQLHAFDTNPFAAAGSTGAGGQEAWSYVPPEVAARLGTDRKIGALTAYPDSSPTLADVYDSKSGTFRTLLVSGEGVGGRQVFALDVTNSVNSALGPPAADGTYHPVPLWNVNDPGNLGTSCGGAATDRMGFTESKPAIVRTKDATGNERWLAIFASGPYASGTDGGKTIYAFDALTGGGAKGCPVWTWTVPDTGVWIDTAVSAVDTSDQALMGTGAIKDGYADFVLAGDSKGRVWMLHAGTGALVQESGFPDVGLTSGGTAVDPAFSTNKTPSNGSIVNPLAGHDVPIAGAVVAAESTTGILQLFFGTASPNPSQANAIYGVRASDGQLVLAQATAPGEQVAGGPVVANGEVIFGTSTLATSTGGLCTPGTGRILAFSMSSLNLLWSNSLSAPIAGPLTASNGEVMATTQNGTQESVGTFTNNSANGVGVTMGFIGWKQMSK